MGFLGRKENGGVRRGRLKSGRGNGSDEGSSPNFQAERLEERILLNADLSILSDLIPQQQKSDPYSSEIVVELQPGLGEIGETLTGDSGEIQSADSNSSGPVLDSDSSDGDGEEMGFALESLVGNEQILQPDADVNLLENVPTDAGEDIESGAVLADDSEVIVEQSEVENNGDLGSVQTYSAVDSATLITAIPTEVDASVSNNDSENSDTEELTKTLLAANPPPTAEVDYSSDVLANTLLENQLQEENTPENLSETEGAGVVYIGDLEGDSAVIAEGQVLSGSGSYSGDVIVNGTISPGNSPGIQAVPSLILTGTSNTEIEIGGLTAGQGASPNADNGYDQIQVSGDVVLGGTLKITLINGFSPSLNDTFDIITYTGSLSGQFDDAEGLFGFGDGSLYFEVVVDIANKKVQLVVKAAPALGGIVSRTQTINDVLGMYFSDYFMFNSSVTIAGEITISDYVTLVGSFEFAVTLLQKVTVATGLSTNLSDAVELALVAQYDALASTYSALAPNLSLSSDVQTITGLPVISLEIGGSNISAFVGVNGPYWTDVDGNGLVGWSFNTGSGNNASRTISSGSVTIDIASIPTLFSATDILPADTIITLLLSDGVLEFGDANATPPTNVRYGDINGNGRVDPNETAELNDNATGLAITNLDFGYVGMMSLIPALSLSLSSSFFHGLKLTASEVALVGVDQVELGAQNVLVEVNTGPTWIAPPAPLIVIGAGPAVVDFAATFPAAGPTPAGYRIGTGMATDPVYVAHDGNERIGASIDNAVLSVGNNSGKWVHLTGNFSFEKGPTSDVTIATGLSTNLSSTLKTLVKAQFSALAALTGSSASLSSDVQTISNVQVASLQIGGSNISAFVGVNGPYWTDVDGDNSVGWSFNTGDGDEASRTISSGTVTIGLTTYDDTINTLLPADTIVTLELADGVLAFGSSTDGTDVRYGDINNNTQVDANETAELNDNATGLAITNVDFGFVALTPTLRLPLLSGQTFTGFKLTASQVGLVGLDPYVELGAQNVLVEVNVGPTWTGFGISGDGPAVVDFKTSFPDANPELVGYEVRTGTNAPSVYIAHDGNERIGASVDDAILSIGNSGGKWVYLTGDLSFEKGPTSDVTIATGISNTIPQWQKDLIDAEFTLRAFLAGSNLTLSGDLQTIENVQVSALQIGGNDITAFIGMDGPYWTDIDFDGSVGWVLPELTDGDDDGTGADVVYLSATDLGPQTAYGDINDDGVVDLGETADATLARWVLPELTDGDDVGDGADVVYLRSTPAGPSTAYGDINDDGEIDVIETAELSREATGVAITNVDFGFVMMTPTFKLPMVQSQTFTALKLTATQVGLVGIDEVLLEANNIIVNLNVGPGWGGTASGMGPAVVNFETSFPNANPELVGYEVRTGTNSPSIYIDHDGNERIGASVEQATLRISEFVHITGSIAFEKGPVFSGVDVTGGLLSGLTSEATALLESLGLPTSGIVGSIPAWGATDTELAFMTIGASNVHAFIGMDGPYWVADLDGDRSISWSFDTGDDDLFPNEASRTITSWGNGSAPTIKVNGADLTVSANYLLPEDAIVILDKADGWIQMGDGGKYGDDDNIGVVDANETAELSEDAAGIVVDNFDFGLAMMEPTNQLDFAKYFALKATAEQIGLVGIENVTLKATQLLVEVNMSSPSIYGNPLFPVVDFAERWASEQLTLFDTNNDKKITLGELATLNFDNSAGISALSGVSLTDATAVDHEMMLAILNTDNSGDSRDVIDLTEAAALLGGDTAALDAAGLADSDHDGKIDPAGFEVDTGGKPVYLSMDSALIRAQGFVEINIFDALYLTGSVAFEMGPTQEVTLTDSTTKTVTTMTIGAANVTAFIGANGPYWTDLDGDHQVSWSDAEGNTLTQAEAGSADDIVDVDETEELDGDAVGFYVNDLDVGIMLMVATAPADLGVYLAAKLKVNGFGLVGIDGLTAEGAFDIELNIGVGLSGFEPSVDPVDFVTSFSEAPALFELLDTTVDGVLNEAEQNAALASGYIGEDITTVAQLVSVLNASGGVPDDYLNISEVLAKLDDSFESANGNQAVIDALDVDGNGRLNTGFEVNTGNPAAPVTLDFDKFLVSIQLGGEIALAGVFRMYGVFLFELDSSGLKAFVAAGLEVGPDIDASNSSKLFSMNALGALVINGDGIAADIEVSVSVGGALSSVLKFDASARLVLNTTGDDQGITIPERYVGFLTGANDVASSIPSSEIHDPSQVSGLAGMLDGRFTLNPDGSATFTIDAGAPRLDGGTDPDGWYFLVSLHGKLTIVRTFKISADFHLKVSGQALELGFNGTVDLGGFVTLDVEGGAVIENGVFAAYAKLAVDIDIAGINISGDAGFEINSGNGEVSVFDALAVEHVIAGNTFRVSIAATIDLFDILEAKGSVEIAIVDGVFSIDVDASIDFFGILDISISGYFSTNGTFSFTGTLNLDLTAGSGAFEFGVTGGLSVTLSNSGFSGTGSVGLVVFGEDINIASATVSVNWNTGEWLIRAEGPLSVWVEITSSNSFPYFSIEGGLGVFGEVLEALGDAAEAVGKAVADAAVAVHGAFVDLGKAILEFGEDVVEFFEDVGEAIADVAEAVWDEISGWFESKRTVITKYTINPKNYYVYSTSLSGKTLTITNGTNDGYAPKLTLWAVDGNLIVDAPDTTKNVTISTSQDQHRHWTNDGSPPWGEWGSWHNTGSVKTQTANINVTNATNFALSSVDKIVIIGTNNAEAIILDRNTISIDTDVNGRGGDDVIATGTGNDRVWGGDGNDTIFTYEGNDELYGGNHNDKLFGGTGNDDLYGGSGNDLLNENLGDENQGRTSPNIPISETNILDGGADNDQILGSPGKDTIEGGSGNDVLVGLANDDTYVFNNSYGTDQFVDYHGKEILDFSGASVSLQLSMSDTGTTSSAGAGHFLSIDEFVAIKEVNLGSGSDHFDITKLPGHQLDITDAGGTDTYDFDFDRADTAQGVARVDIEDTGGSGDRIDLDVDSTDHDIYLHPLAVLLNSLDLTFNAGVEELNITDHATDTTVTTSLSFTTLLVKSGVTISSATDGQIELLARDDFTLQVGALIETAGNVIIRGDYDNVDSTGATIDLLGTINADTVAVFGNVDDDTVNVSNVTSGSETTISTGTGSDVVNIRTIDAETTVNAGADDDTINVGSNAAGTLANRNNNQNGNLNSISALLTINGDAPSASDTLNIDDTADILGNTGVLTSTQITGLGMASGITYGTIETLNISLGSGGDTFTIQSTHTAVTNLSSNDGGDVVNVRTIAGATTVNGGNDSDTINVGSNAQGTIANANNNSGGTVDGIGALLTINGNDPSNSGDTLNVDDTAETADNIGTLTATTITGLDMGGSIAYGTVETLNINLGEFVDTFTIENTHAGSTSLNSNGGADIINIQDIDGATTVNGGTGSDTIVINGTDGTLTVNGEADDDVITVNATGASSSSTLNGQAGNDVFNIKAMNGPVVVSGGDDDDTINVGSNAAGTIGDEDNNQGGDVNSIAALLTLEGDAPSASDTLNIDDTADILGNTGVLTSTQLTGLGMTSGITYGTIETLNISLGSGDDTFTIQSTHAAVTNLSSNDGGDVVNVRTIAGATTVNGGNDSDTINVGSNAQGTIANASNNSGGTVDGIGALLTINGNDPSNSGDTLNIDDTAETTNNTGTLTATTITGLDMGGSIAYGTVETLNINLGDFVDTFTIESTHLGQTNLNSNGGADIINIRTISGATTVNGGIGSDTINVGSNAQGAIGDVSNNSGGTADGIEALLTINGNSPSSSGDTLNVDDTGDGTGDTGSLTSTTITGLFGTGGSIAYGSLETLNIDLGTGDDVFTIQSTHSGSTTVSTGPGTDTTTINGVSGILVVNGQADDDIITVNGTGASSSSTLNGQAGSDIFNIRAINGPVIVSGGDDDDTINVGSTAPTIGGNTHGIAALLIINGDGNSAGGDTLNVDDSGDDTAETGTLTSTTIVGLFGTGGSITYGTLETLNIDLGSGGDTFNILSTHAGTTTLDALGGSDTVNIQTISGPTTVNTGDAADTINVGSLAPAVGGTVNAIGDSSGDLLYIDAGSESSQDILNVDDTGDTLANTGILTWNTLTGLDMSEGIEYYDIEVLNISLGTGGDDFYIESTHTTETNLNTGDGVSTVGTTVDTSRSVWDLATWTADDVVDINTIAGLTNVNGQAGNDFVNVNVDSNGDRTDVNGIAAVLNLDGNGDNDTYTLHLAGSGDALINVSDSGLDDDGTDYLIVHGSANDDTFLLRKNFLALLNDDDVERVNYDENINGRLIVSGHDGDDYFAVDDNSSITTLDGGAGGDTFQIGQLFNTPRADEDGFNASNYGIAYDDQFETLEAYAGYLSRGTSRPLTAYGGDGEDIFSVYHNTAVVRLEGEAGNDEFIVRAFALVNAEEGDEQEMTELDGGEGDDLIQYAINAPVSIDGGAGMDTVIIIGTLLDDSFVVTSDGIVGAGLSVTFENVERAEVDGLEGDDNFFIRSTNAAVVTTVIGGPGSDTFSVLGDVTETIIGGAQLEGEPGVITHGITSSDTDYSSLRVDGVGVMISQPAEGETAVAIIQTDGATVVSEFGLNDTYSIQLLGDIPIDLTILYLTVSAAIPSTDDQELDPASDTILVSTDGVTFSRSVVLTFDSSSNWNTAQTITVKAIDDTAAEGERTAMISHSINSDDAALQAIVLPDVRVTIGDDDLFGIVITQTDGRTEVHEGGAIGILASDTYTVELTHSITSGQVVVDLTHDSDVTLSATTLTFTSAITTYIVTVTAPLDTAENTEFSEIIHTIDTGSSTDTRFNSSDAQTVTATVFDGDSAGVLVLETDGATRVIGDGNDTYRLVLTSKPLNTVTIQITTDGQTVVSPTSVFFTTTDWNTPQEITVTKHPDFEPTEGTEEVFAPQRHTLDHIAGPLVIEGGIGAGRDRSLVESVMLPTETDDEAEAADDSPAASADTDDDVDVLNIFNDDSNAVHPDGLLVDSNLRGTSEIAEGEAALTHNNLSGLGMGDDLTLDLGEDVVFGGGITFNDVEIVEIMLGKGSETLDIALAVDIADNADAAILAVHGGGDDDTFTVDNDRSTPMVLYGDTSQDGSRYDGAEGNASLFNNPGNDIINASDSSESIAIYGGPQNDTIWGSQDGDHIAGGSGGDEIHGQDGIDHIYGDSGFNVDLATRTLTVHVIPDAGNLLMTQDQLVPGEDDVYGDGGDDIILGDHGIITQTDGTERLFTTGSVIQIETTTDLGGANDTIFGGEGQDLILGGEGADNISGDAGMDVLIGDYGLIVDSDADITTLDTVKTTDENLGAADTINGDDDDDIIIGGVAGDTINGNAGDDVILGDNAELTSVEYDATDIVTIGEIESRIAGLGAGDTIYGNSGDDVLIGGEGGDRIDGNEDKDLILGDNGVLTDTDGDTANPRFRVLEGTVIYGETPGSNDGDPLIDHNNEFSDPAGIPQWAKWQVTLNNDSGGDDYIAGGPDNDQIFGQTGDDIIQGDGSILAAVDAYRDIDGLLVVSASVEDATDGDDYIEGNGGNDVIFGNLGQDDIVGGSSELFGLDAASQRIDGEDLIFGGAGTDLARNNEGDTSTNGHARDADVIVGDNGNIYRLVGVNGIDGGAYLTFNYDDYDVERIIVRVAELIDYTPGGPDFDPTAAADDKGASDEIHGESGDDVIYGQTGDDVLFGEGQDDDLIGGWGSDFISGGTGIDGILGDDGRIYTSRNTSGDTDELAEPLYGIYNVETDRNSDRMVISTPGRFQEAEINIEGQLLKTVNLAPFNVDPDTATQDPLFDPIYSDDILYGGLGGDFIHGGAGDDAISGAEALPQTAAMVYPEGTPADAQRDDGVIVVFGYDKPLVLSKLEAELGFGVRLLGFETLKAEEFAAYDEYEPRQRISIGDDEFFLNFNADEGDEQTAGIFSDGDDRLFGDLGNDWIVGGTGRDHIYGGRGNDLMNADDDLATNAGLNDLPDGPEYSYEDIAYGGAGRDVLIANTGGDRLIDWVGEFNSYIVPFAQFGPGTISRMLQPQLREYLYDLSAADGADATRAADTGNDAARNGEPDGELGVVEQKDDDWHDQTGAPDDPQPGNIPGGKRDTLAGADFNFGSADNFAPDSGTWKVSGGRLEVEPEVLGSDAVSVFYVDKWIPTYFEIKATINAGKPTAGYKSNAYLIFDYQSPTDFKFAGINISNDKLEMGHRDAAGWHVDVQANARLKPKRDYRLLLALNGTTATLVVNNKDVFTHVYAPRVDADGFSYGLNAGMVGIGAYNSKARIDNVSVEVLPPETTLEITEDFSDSADDLFTGASLGQWQIVDSRYEAMPATGQDVAFTDTGLGIAAPYLIRIQATLSTDSTGGFIFDQYSDSEFKFAAISSETGQVIIGHHTSRKGWVIDASTDRSVASGTDYELQVTLKGTTVSVELDGQVVLGYNFNANVVDGDFGLMTRDGGSSFADARVSTDDPAFIGDAEEPPPPPEEPTFTIIEIDVRKGMLQTRTGIWRYRGSRAQGMPKRGRDTALTTLSVEVTSQGLLEIEATVYTGAQVGLVFDYYAWNDFKFASLLSNADKVVIGHRTAEGWFYDEVADVVIDASTRYSLVVSAIGDSVTVSLDGETVLSHTFVDTVTDGEIGLLSRYGSSSFYDVVVRIGEPNDAGGGNSMMADSEAPDQVFGDVESLSSDELSIITSEAIAQWSDLGDLDNSQLNLLSNVTFQVVDLPDLMLGQSDGATVLIDSTAAGYGWFVDLTPSDHAEYGYDLDDGSLLATESSPAVGKMDLLTVVMHELGHVLGLSDLESEDDPGALMSPTLEASTRLLACESLSEFSLSTEADLTSNYSHELLIRDLRPAALFYL